MGLLGRLFGHGHKTMQMQLTVTTFDDVKVRGVVNVRFFLLPLVCRHHCAIARDSAVGVELTLRRCISVVDPASQGPSP